MLSGMQGRALDCWLGGMLYDYLPDNAMGSGDLRRQCPSTSTFKAAPRRPSHTVKIIYGDAAKLLHISAVNTQTQY